MFFFLIASTAIAQRLMTMEEALQLALANNLQVKAGGYEIKQFHQLKKAQSEAGKTNVTWMHGKYNSVNIDNNYTITQTIPFPTVLASQLKLGEAQTDGARLNLAITKNELIYQVRNIYLQLCYLTAFHQLLLSQDSLFNGFARASSLRYQTGEANLLEKTTAESQLMEIKNQLRLNESNFEIYQTQLQILLNSPEEITPSEPLQKLSFEDSSSLMQNPSLAFSKQQLNISQRLKKVEQNRFLPDITIGYFTQSLIGYQQIGNDEVYFGRNKKFTGFEVGLSIPVLFWAQAGRSKAAYFNEEAARKKYDYTNASLKGQLKQAQLELAKNYISLDYYETSALKNASFILQQAQKSYHGGDIGYLEYLQALKNVQSIRANYLLSLYQFDQSVIHLKYLTGEN
jgi:cobalt-zinc-cadmium resistance protein CzcA